MNEYNFEELSPLRFEKLVRDILKKVYGTFENFAEGKDGGIDFRYSKCNDSILVVQCKKYKNYHNLKASLKREKLKLESLIFTDYLIVVSLELTPKQKSEIFNMFEEVLLEPNQIITRGDLNECIQSDKSLIYEYPELWMKSLNIHQQIFNIGILNHADFIKERISRTLISFVPTIDYNNILKHYEEHNVLIISGNPGVGKSTIAYAVISNFIFHKSYKVIDVSYRAIQEAELFLVNDEPIIFLIDDFLGQIRLEKNDDFGRLLSYFIEKIECSENKKLIITTRNYVLETGIKSLSSINTIDHLIQKYIIELNHLKRSARVEMLYNHLKNSNIEYDYLNNLLENDYKKIIDHANFNPRIIEHLTKFNLLNKSKILPEEYYDFFLQNLRDSSTIWKQFYENLPNDLYKLIIINKFIINDKISYEILERAIMVFIQNCRKFHHYSFDDFRQIIRELNGTVFIIEDGYDEMTEEGLNVIEFHNPSIVDFINNYIWTNKYWLKIIIENAIFFEQLFNWDFIDIIEEDEELLNCFKNKICKDFGSFENASFGLFEHVIEDGGSTYSWKRERRYFFLQEFLALCDYKEDAKVSEFIRKELFQHSFDGPEDASEKIIFAQICEDLLKEGLVEDVEVIKKYTNGFLGSIKEYVYLEYLLRYCSKKCFDIVKSKKEFAEDADRLFVWKFEDIDKETDYINLIDLIDDYRQVKRILPLRKATKIFDGLEISKKLSSSLHHLKTKKQSIKSENSDYFDIDNIEIEEIISSLKNDC